MSNIALEYAEAVASDLERIYDGEYELDEYDLETYFYEHDLGRYYIIDENLDYYAVRIYITVGGPTAIIDTLYGQVIVNWGGYRGAADIRSEIVEWIDRSYSYNYELAKE